MAYKESEASYNWLFGTEYAVHCEDITSWDNDQKTVGSRVFLAALFSLAVALIVLLRRRRAAAATCCGGASLHLAARSPEDNALEANAEEKDLEENAGGNSPGSTSSHTTDGSTAATKAPRSERMWHLDYARIVCVACVVAEHSGGAGYSHNNVFFVLQWVLPYLYITSGICSVLSSAPLWYYLGRLMVVLFVGVGANLTADIITGRRWWEDLGNLVFQMFYVVMLIGMAMLGQPLRSLLRRGTDTLNRSIDRRIVVCMFLWAAVVVAGSVCFVASIPLVQPMGSDDGSFVSTHIGLIEHIPILLVEVFGVLLLSALACVLGTTRLVGWILLAVIYLPRVVIPWQGVGYAHNLQLYILGMVVAKFPLAGKERLCTAIRMYWPLLLGFLMLVSVPNTYGRCDITPPSLAWERFRFYQIEFCLVVCFVSGAMNTSDDHNVTGWLGAWALYAFCFHAAWYRVLPVPYGALATYASIPLFYAMHRWRVRTTKKGGLKEESHEKEESAQQQEDSQSESQPQPQPLPQPTQKQIEASASGPLVERLCL